MSNILCYRNDLIIYYEAVVQLNTRIQAVVTTKNIQSWLYYISSYFLFADDKRKLLFKSLQQRNRMFQALEGTWIFGVERYPWNYRLLLC